MIVTSNAHTQAAHCQATHLNRERPLGSPREIKRDESVPLVDEEHASDQPRMTLGTAGMTIALSLLFTGVCSLPIWHTDVWGHLSYGRYIWTNRALPQTEPFLPFSKGMPFVDAPWLSQLIGYGVVSTPRLQLAGLQGLLAIGVTLCGALLSWSTYRVTNRGWCGIVTLVLFLLVGGGPLLVLRPQLAGLVCFVVVLMRSIRRPVRKSDWIVIPLTFVFWANLHPSFVVGLGLLCCLCCGRAIDVLARSGSFRLMLCDPKMIRVIQLTALSAVAVLVNPYSVRLYGEVFQFSSCENLQDLTEWQPLNIREPQGFMFASMTLLLIIIYRFTPRRVRSWELMSLAGFGFAAAWSSRMLIWWAPVVSLLIPLHGFAIWRQIFGRPLVVKRRGYSNRWSLASVTVAVVCFVISPLGRAIIFDQRATVKKAVSSFTPVFAAEFFREHPPTGPVFNTFEWGDYLLWAGPKNLELFVNSHAHLIPREIWLAYMQVSELRSGWEETLDRYGINTIVVDQANRAPLIKALMQNENWQHPPIQQDGQVIFFRKRPVQIQVQPVSRLRSTTD